MKNHLLNRLLSLLLAAVMVLGLLPAASAAPTGVHWEKADVEGAIDKADRLIEDTIHPQTTRKPTDMVRVSIVLEGEPTLRAGYATMDIGSNATAMAYDRDLKKVQQTMAKTISVQALEGKPLDVVWNLTLVSNIISANVPYGSIDAVKAVAGVRDVVIERQYEKTVEEAVSPDMYTSSAMIGSSAVWQSGYTGAGTRIAVVDTGTDTDHQSFSNTAYLHALKQNADECGMSYDSYVSGLDLLDQEEVDRVLQNLNAAERIGYSDASAYWISEKLPFGANYVDYNLVVDHDHDGQGSHGSHVAGIAAANRYLSRNGQILNARQEVYMTGVAPDAQIITLKVFGNGPGPYDSDYFAAIEDAIWLGCDSVNLSLGSSSPGYSENYLFEELLDFMTTTDTVVVISAGNSGHWAEQSANGYLYNDGVSFHTSGSPGTYTNSLAVASVDNDGAIGNYIQVGDRMIVYTETTGYLNSPMTTLDRTSDKSGTEYDFVFIDGFGEESDYSGIDLNGKIVFCSRGTTSFFEKGNTAASLGAAATVIYNNTSGPFGMDLTDYSYYAPCVSITQADGAAVKAAATRNTTAAGLVYYTGKVTVSGQMGVSSYGSDYYTMSTFSSWGVPTSLELKPEITAPGGQIWSVNGVDTSGTAYELMSGTSMAAPQVTGMAALVAEYIRDKGLDARTGLSVRELAQSLLMSTATPLREEASGGEYYSILNQGAGLARVDLATTAGSYVLVEGMPDGKVKAELGEDPDRLGVYGFSFTIHDLAGRDQSYTLSADLFTQDVFPDGNGILYLDTWTRSLPVKAKFWANGQSLESSDGFECDLNGDGVTNAADADFLLEYTIGNVSELKDGGDLNGDGEISTYDAHILLTKLSGDFTVDVPASGSVTIEVRLELTDEAHRFLNTYYPTGAYIESFVYAEAVSDEEGIQGVTHSIPVLGYYGSWSEPGMYDVGSFLEYSYGAEKRAPYLYNINGIRSNYVTINYGDGSEYLFGGNPITEEADYLPRRNAFNNELGYTLQALRFTLIRNAAASMILLKNADTGEVYLQQELGEAEGAYFYTNQQAWQNTQYKVGLGLDFTGIPEGTRLELSLISAPELYCKLDISSGVYTADWSALEDGAYLTTSFTIDNTAPVVKNVELAENSTLRVTAKDGEYIAAVALMNAAGTSILTAAAANQTEKGVELTTELDLSAVFGSEFLVAVYDYAENVSYYKITLELNNERPYFTAIDRTTANDDNSVNYVGMYADGSSVNLAPTSGREPARAAEYVQGYVFEVSNDNRLYVGADADLYSFTELGALDPSGEWAIIGFNDLAYNKADSKLYGCFYSERNDMAMPYLCTIDMYTGAMTVLGEMPIDANAMTIDGQGNFYSTIYGESRLYTYRSDVVSTGKTTYVGSLSGFSTTKLNSLAWDHNENELYWACSSDGSTSLLKLDPKTAAVTHIQTFDFIAVGLYIAYEPTGDPFAPVDTVTSVSLPGTADMLVNTSLQLQAQVRPWNVSDATVTWSSSDPSVATVDEAGLVFGKKQGTAVITAVSKLDSTKRASCTVTVTALNRDLKSLVWDEEGQVHWASFNTDTLPAYKSLKTVTPNLPFNATMVADGTLYASTLDTSNGLSDLYTVDPATFAMTKVGGSSSIGYLDMAYSPSLGYGLGVYFNYITLIDLSTGEYLGAWDWTEGVAGDLVGITYYGSEYNSNYGAYMDYFLILDNRGNVYLDAFISTGSQMGYFSGPGEGYVTTIGKSVDYSYFQGFHYDGSYTYWTRFNEADNVVELIVWDCDGTGESHSMGYFADGVWPVGGLYTDAEINGTMALADKELDTIRTAELMTDLPTVQMDAAGGSLNAAVATAPVVNPMSKGDITETGDVDVEITVPEEAANGFLSITYDAEKLAVTGVTGVTEAFAWNDNDGYIRIAFADRDALAKDSAAAIVHFEALAEGETTFGVMTWELNDSDGPLYDQAEDITVTLPHICPSESFVDVNEGDWWHTAVDYVVSRGYMNGMDPTHYGPALNMIRAQFVTVLYRMEGEPAVNNTGVFSDVPENQFYTNAAYWALSVGITNGTTPSTFNPTGQLTRTELVTFMYRYARYKGYDTSAAADLSAFRDAGQILPFAVDPWKWSVGNGIVSGMSADTLAPLALTNRAQAAVIFQRFDSKLTNN